MSDLLTLLKVSAKGVGAKLTSEQSSELAEQIEQLQAQVKQLEQGQMILIRLNRNAKFKQFIAENKDVIRDITPPTEGE